MQYSSVTFSSVSLLDWQKDILISDLADIGFDTFEDREDGFVGYIPSANLNIAGIDGVLMSNAFASGVQYKIEEIEDRNWNELWESNFQPIIVDDQCYVRATFHDSRPEFPYEIVIEPKMAFGTGHHQTTSLMLSYLLEAEVAGKSVIDMGCGTGILAILAAKLGAGHTAAVDYDDVCVASVHENTQLNGIDHIQASLGSAEQLQGKTFDIILANINRNILLEHLSAYSAALPSGGQLFLSGFYDGEDLEMLKQKAAQNGLTFDNKKVKDNWCAAKFIKSE